LFKPERSPCLKSGMTLEHFHSSGKTPDSMEWLKIEQRELAMRSALD
jgi:hypothetical protein